MTSRRNIQHKHITKNKLEKTFRSTHPEKESKLHTIQPLLKIPHVNHETERFEKNPPKLKVTKMHVSKHTKTRSSPRLFVGLHKNTGTRL